MSRYEDQLLALRQQATADKERAQAQLAALKDQLAAEQQRAAQLSEARAALEADLQVAMQRGVAATAEGEKAVRELEQTTRELTGAQAALASATSRVGELERKTADQKGHHEAEVLRLHQEHSAAVRALSMEAQEKARLVAQDHARQVNSPTGQSCACLLPAVARRWRTSPSSTARSCPPRRRSGRPGCSAWWGRRRRS